MKREEAVKLLEDLKANFDSIESTIYVMLKKEKGSWELQIKWTPTPDEMRRLKNQAAEKGIKVTFDDDLTKFSKS